MDEKAAKPSEPKRESLSRPKGPAPKAMVHSRHAGGSIEREGRGFSVGELHTARFPALYAWRWKLPLDLRRRSVNERNVEALKKWFVPIQAEPHAAKPAGKIKEPSSAKPKKSARKRKRRTTR